MARRRAETLPALRARHECEAAHKHWAEPVPKMSPVLKNLSPENRATNSFESCDLAEVNGFSSPMSPVFSFRRATAGPASICKSLPRRILAVRRGEVAERLKAAVC